MKSVAILSFLPLLVPALPSPSGSDGVSRRGAGSNIQLSVYNPGMPTDGKIITACNGVFWIGGTSCTSHPDNISAPPDNTGAAVISYSPSAQTAGMNTVVPGGQQVYIGPGYALKYTAAHTGGPPADEGAVLTGFSYKPYKPWDGPVPGSLSWQGNEMYACPPVGATNGAEYQVFAKLPGRGCQSFMMAAVEYDGEPTWQYD